MFINFFPKIKPFYDNMKKYGRARQVTDGNKIQYSASTLHAG